MLKSLCGGDSSSRIESYQFQKKVNGIGRHFFNNIEWVLGSESRESGLKIGNLANSRPFFFSGSSEKLKNFENLVNFTVPDKKRFSLIQL